MVHYAQLYRHKYFAMFDYGSSRRNFLKYGQNRPPSYDLSRINSTEIALFYARNDLFADPADVAVLRDTLAHLPLLVDHLIPDQSFNHLDFTYHERTGTLVHPFVLDLLIKYA